MLSLPLCSSPKRLQMMGRPTAVCVSVDYWSRIWVAGVRLRTPVCRPEDRGPEDGPQPPRRMQLEGKPL